MNQVSKKYLTLAKQSAGVFVVLAAGAAVFAGYMAMTHAGQALPCL